MKDQANKPQGRPNYVRPLAGAYLVYLGGRLLYGFWKDGADDVPPAVLIGAAVVFIGVGGWLVWGEWQRYKYELAHKDDPETWNDELAEAARRESSAGDEEEDAP